MFPERSFRHVAVPPLEMHRQCCCGGSSASSSRTNLQMSWMSTCFSALLFCCHLRPVTGDRDCALSNVVGKLASPCPRCSACHMIGLPPCIRLLEADEVTSKSKREPRAINTHLARSARRVRNGGELIFTATIRSNMARRGNIHQCPGLKVCEVRHRRQLRAERVP